MNYEMLICHSEEPERRNNLTKFWIVSFLLVACLPAGGFAMTERGYFVIHGTLLM